jgi:hypothetical protein
MLEKLKRQLAQAVEVESICRTALESLQEFRDLQEAVQAVKELRKQIDLEQSKINGENAQRMKQEIIAAGFEIRTGHTTGSTNHRDWQSDNGEPWTFLIVHASVPQVTHVSESSRGEDFVMADDSDFNEAWLLGHGETEDEAWEVALENWVDEEFKAAAIPGNLVKEETTCNKQ